MAVTFVQNHTTGTSASGTAVTATLAANVPMGNTLYVWVAMDNTSATTPVVSSIDKPGGETNSWAQLAKHDASSATSAAAVRGELWGIVTTQQWNSGTVITATLSASPPKSHMLCREFSGASITLRGTAGTNTSTTGVPSAATSGTAIVSGDLVLGAATFETSTTPTGDADTAGGSWSTALTGNTGGGASAAQVSSIFQHKIVNATGVQTYNPTASSSDSGAAVVALQPGIVIVSGIAVSDFAFSGTVAGLREALGAAAGNYTLTSAASGNELPVPDAVASRYDATKITGLADTDPVTQWSDGTANAFHATQGTTANKPSYRTNILNGKPVVRFDGTTDFLEIPYNAGLNPSTMTLFAVVVARGGAGTFRSPITSRESNPTSGYIFYATDANLYAFWTGTNDTTVGIWTQVGTAAATVDAPRILVGRADGTTVDMWVNGASAGSATAGITVNDAFPARLGAGSTEIAASFFWNGDIAEVILYSRALTTTERQQVESFLTSKWVVTTTTGAAAGDYTLTGAVAGRRTSDWSASASATTQAGGAAVTAQGAYSFSGAVVGQREVLGAATATLAFTGAAAGTPEKLGQAADALTFSSTALGAKEVFGQVAESYSLSGAASAAPTKLGAAAGSFSFSGAATGQREVLGTAASALSFDGTAVGTREVLGQALGAHSFTGTAIGQIVGAVSGTAQANLTFTGTVAAVPEKLGAAAASLDLTAAVAGTRTALGQAAASLTFSGAVTGTVTGPNVVTGTALGDYALTGTTAGVRIAVGQATAALTLTGTTAGVRIAVGQATAALTLTGTTAGATVEQGAAIAAIAFAAQATGLIITIPPPRYVEGDLYGANLVEGATAGSGITEGALVGVGIVEGATGI